MKYYAVLDIGTYKSVLALRLVDGAQDSLVYAAEKSCGIDSDGKIGNRLRVIHLIQSLLQQVKHSKNVEVKEVYLAYRGGEIEAVEYEVKRRCSEVDQRDGALSVAPVDVEYLNTSFQKYDKVSADKVLVDHVVTCYSLDGEPVRELNGKYVLDYQKFIGQYAKEVSCKFLLFLAPRDGYNRLMSVLEACGLTCKGTYLGLRAEEPYIFDREQPTYMFGVANMGYSHSELGIFRDGVLERYFYFDGGWNQAREKLVQKDATLSLSDLEYEKVQKLDFGNLVQPFRKEDTLKDSCIAEGDSEEDDKGATSEKSIAKKPSAFHSLVEIVATELEAVYFSKICGALTESKIQNVSLGNLLAARGGIILSGGLVQNKSLVNHFNAVLAKKRKEEVHKESVRQELDEMLSRSGIAQEDLQIAIKRVASEKGITEDEVLSNLIAEAKRVVNQHFDERSVEGIYKMKAPEILKPTNMSPCSSECAVEGMLPLLTVLGLLKLVEKEGVSMSLTEEPKPVQVETPEESEAAETTRKEEKTSSSSRFDQFFGGIKNTLKKFGMKISEDDTRDDFDESK
ncbi:MAG: hypothetical protein ACTTKF_01860 [Bacteroides sp.]